MMYLNRYHRQVVWVQKIDYENTDPSRPSDCHHLSASILAMPKATRILTNLVQLAKDVLRLQHIEDDECAMYVSKTDPKYLDPKSAEAASAREKENKGWYDKEVVEDYDYRTAKSKLRDGSAIYLRTLWLHSRKDDGTPKARNVILGNHDPRTNTDNNVPVSGLASLRLVLALARFFGLLPELNLWLADVKQAYLNAPIDSKTHILIARIDGGHGYQRLLKATYGLTDSGRKWFDLLKAKLLANGFRALDYEPAMFYNGSALIATVVDDLMCLGKAAETILLSLDLQYGRMEKLGMHNTLRFSGVDITYVGNYVFKLNTCYKVMVRDTTWKREAHTPFPSRTAAVDIEADQLLPPVLHTKVRSIVGMMSWICNATRPDLSYAVGWLSRKTAAPTDLTLSRAERLLAHARQHRADLYVMAGVKLHSLDVYSDATWGAIIDDMKSCTGILIYLRWTDTDGDGVALPITTDENGETVQRSLLQWKYSLQTRVSHSSMASELNAAVDATKLGLYWQSLLKELGISVPINLFLDARNVIEAVYVKKRSLPTDKSLTTNLNYLRQAATMEEMAIHHVPSEAQLADELTKAKSNTHLVVHH